MKLAVLLVVGALAASVFTSPAASSQTLSAQHRLARDIYKELIEINTTDWVGSTTVAAEGMAKRLKDAGYAASEVQVLGAAPRRGNLVARLRWHRRAPAAFTARPYRRGGGSARGLVDGPV